MSTVLEVKGMSCGHCVASVTDAVKKVPGVTDVTVSLEDANAVIHGDFDIDAVREAVTKVGFEPGEAAAGS